MIHSPNLFRIAILFSALAPMIAFASGPVPGPEQDYGKKLAKSLEYVDFYDWMKGITNRNGMPWALYDQPDQSPLLERWEKAEKISKEIETNPDATSLQEQLSRMHLALTGGDGFRTTPIEGAGDVFVYGIGYYPISAAEKAVLESNPYLITRIIKNPYEGVKAEYLARHEYPSTRNYAKVESKLSPGLREKLVAARIAGTLEDFENETTRELNRLILKELIADLDSQKKMRLSPEAFYQKLISIHPFADFNGRTFRSLYKAYAKRPLFMNDWNSDLLLSPEDFRKEVRRGDRHYEKILQGLRNAEAKDPAFPKYFDTPELYAVLLDELGVRGDIEAAKNVLAKGDAQELIRQKRFSEVRLLIRDECLRLLQNRR